ncbi:MAG: hypothetical protein M3Y82_01525 [Verrucomicrobiota bacterium]|nr:hypothetical protein [Verrucomicrobiota bacterium]
MILGSTGDSPVPSGDPPDGINKQRFEPIKNDVLAIDVSVVPVGGSPTEGGRVARTTHF